MTISADATIRARLADICVPQNVARFTDLSAMARIRAGEPAGPE